MNAFTHALGARGLRNVTGMTSWDGPGLDAWHPWTPAEAAHALDRAHPGHPWLDELA